MRNRGEDRAMSLRQIDVSGEERRAGPRGDRPDLIWVRTDALRINEAYQRPIERRGWKTIRRIADNFTWGRFSPLLVAGLADGFYAVIDGQSPLGTLPRDMAVLARMLMVDREHFEALCALSYGPLHKWRPCRRGDEVRLYHPFILATLTEAISRKEDNRARMEAANTHKRLQRLRATLAGYQADLAKNDAAVRWIDEWLIAEGCEYRSANWIERGMRAWSNHMFDLGRQGGRS